MGKIITLSELRKLNKQVSLGEISSMRMVEIINEKANENTFEIAHHFYRQGFFEQKSEQFERHYEAYLKEKKL